MLTGTLGALGHGQSLTHGRLRHYLCPPPHRIVPDPKLSRRHGSSDPGSHGMGRGGLWCWRPPCMLRNFSTTVYAQKDIHGCFSEQSIEKLVGEGGLGCWSRSGRSEVTSFSRPTEPVC